MAIRPIRLFPDTVLSQPSQPVHAFDHRLYKLIQDLTDTLYHSPGVGLAAPQIGVLEQVSVIDTGRSFAVRTSAAASRDIITLINPVVVSSKGLQLPREGCLSVPEWLANVRRFQEVEVLTDAVRGGKQLIKRHGFEALALQHEIDHLQGQLFLDRVADLKTDLFRRKTYRKNSPNG